MKKKYLLEKTIGFSPPWIMGILNVTPDSFSDGGLYFTPSEAIKRAEMMIKQGAHIIDVGGESSALGSKTISAEEEISRIEPVLKKIGGEITVSVDTCKAKVAKMAYSYGAKIINDISACRSDPLMPELLKEKGLFVILMHSKEKAQHPIVSNGDREYSNLITDITEFLKTRINSLLAGGIKKERIIIDPGYGNFLSLNHQISWELLKRFSELEKEFPDFPLVVAVSRKGFLSSKGEERDLISQIVAFDTLTKGASIIRTHDVAMARVFLDVYNNLSNACFNAAALLCKTG